MKQSHHNSWGDYDESAAVYIVPSEFKELA